MSLGLKVRNFELPSEVFRIVYKVSAASLLYHLFQLGFILLHRVSFFGFDAPKEYYMSCLVQFLPQLRSILILRVHVNSFGIYFNITSEIDFCQICLSKKVNSSVTILYRKVFDSLELLFVEFQQNFVKVWVCTIAVLGASWVPKFHYSYSSFVRFL